MATIVACLKTYRRTLEGRNAVTGPPTPAALLSAVSDLWRLAPPGPENLFNAHSFVRLREICEQTFGAADSPDALGIGLHSALRTLGLPCHLPSGKQALALSAIDAASRLDRAFRQTETLRTHLCPLDCADALPPLTFGPAVVRAFSAAELADLMDIPRLRRTFPSLELDMSLYASFSWLVVKETVAVNGEPGKRAVPFFYTSINHDFGAIKPHPRRFPQIVEAALFALLLVPWEDWVENLEIDWRAFRTPWVYTIDEDIFPALSAPPLPSTLSWEPCLFTDSYGERIEGERPVFLNLSTQAQRASDWICEQSWNKVQMAGQAMMFSGPVSHFLLRAFLSNGIDEFLAHITAIEAGLGAKIDYNAGERPKMKGSNPGATVRVATRLSSLLGDVSISDDFTRLFGLRSAFLHGRTLPAIPSSDRVLARRLARRAAAALIEQAAAEPTTTREAFLQRLLDG